MNLAADLHPLWVIAAALALLAIGVAIGVGLNWPESSGDGDE